MNGQLGTRRRGEFASELVATGYAYPRATISNDEFFARCRFPIVADAAGRAALVADTRMKTRRWCGPDENTWTMAQAAVAMAMASSPVPATEIDLVLVSSCSTIPMVNVPHASNPVMADLAPLVLAQLGRDDGVGIDLKAGYCAGFLRGLEVMDAMLQTGAYRAGLIVASDEGGRFATAESNRSGFCFIVGDAAGAVVCKPRPRADGIGLVDCLTRTVPSLADLTSWGADGRSLFVKGARAGAAGLELMLDAGRQLLARNHMTGADVDWLLPAQTHVATVEALGDGLGVPRAKLCWSGDVTGYSASASIAASLGERRQAGTLRKGDLVLSLAVGAGMNVAAALYYC
jgi:3-oxoacyl-[acyl-carrier-protein] synthase-3